MTIAEKFYAEYTKIGYDYEYNRKDFIQWNTLMDKIREEAISESEECPESCDSAVVFMFEDGSSLYVGNPKQGEFDGFMYVC